MSTDGRLTRALSTGDLAVYYLSSGKGVTRTKGYGVRDRVG